MDNDLRQFITAVAVKRNVEVPLDLVLEPGPSLEVNYNLIEEETQELLQALDDVKDGHGSRIEVLKEAIDVMYVVTHMLVTFGFDAEAAWKIIQENNLSKIEKGTIRADGKLLKPKDYVKPDLSKVA